MGVCEFEMCCHKDSVVCGICQAIKNKDEVVYDKTD